jgi:hypothetical protein
LEFIIRFKIIDILFGDKILLKTVLVRTGKNILCVTLYVRILFDRTKHGVSIVNNFLTVQLTTLNMMDPARSSDLSYRYQIEQQQSSSGLFVQEQYIPAVIGILQPAAPIAIIPCDIANSNAYNNYLIRAQRYGTQLPQEQRRLPYPYIPRRVLPAITSDSPNTPCIASYSSGHNSGLTSSSNHHLPAALPSQASHLPPGPMPLARPEEQEIHVAPPQVSNSPRSHKLHIIRVCICFEVISTHCILDISRMRLLGYVLRPVLS